MPFRRESLGELREKAKLTIEEIAEGSGIGRSSVYKHLNGETLPKANHLDAYYDLARRLDCDNIVFYEPPRTGEE